MNILNICGGCLSFRLTVVIKSILISAAVGTRSCRATVFPAPEFVVSSARNRMWSACCTRLTFVRQQNLFFSFLQALHSIYEQEAEIT